MNADIVAAIFAHPDDEALAAGGTIARLADRGAACHVLILATGLAARGPADAAAIESLRGQARESARRLGAVGIDFAEFPDNRMDTVALLDVVQAIEAFFGRTRADTVLTHHPGDLNVDHGLVARAAMTAARPLPASRVRRVWAGEVPSASEWGLPGERFVPQAYVDIGATLDRKLAALAAYTGEMRGFPHPRSAEAVTHLARWRGAECGVAAAEAFVILREIVR
jgi:LmbE family N-acetylglucosaminyl deacetylase